MSIEERNRRINELKFWLHSDNPQAIAWRADTSPATVKGLGAELRQLQQAARETAEEEKLAADLQAFKEAMATGHLAQKREEEERRRQERQQALEEKRREKEAEKLARVKRRAEYEYRQAGGDPAAFEQAWEETLKDEALARETSAERARNERKVYRPSL